MKKTTLRQAAMKLALVAFALLAPLGLSAQSPLTIGTGETFATTGSSGNAQGSALGNPYNYYSTAQFIYTADELVDMQALAAPNGSVQINSVSFYHNANSFGGTVNIYLAHTDASTVDASSPATTGTLVYTGTDITLGSGSAEWQTFVFDEPFIYNGQDNLLIIVSRSKRSSGSPSYSSSQSWQYSTTTNNMFMQRSSDSQGYEVLTNTTYSYTASTNRPNIQIAYQTPATCPLPTLNEVAGADIAPTSAIVRWIASDANQTLFDIYWSQTNSAPDEETIPLAANQSGSSYTITGLTPAHTYYVWIRGNCGTAGSPDISGGWTSAKSFITACDIIQAAGYSENFDGYAVASEYTAPATRVLPACWSAINTTTYATYKQLPSSYYYSYTNYANSTPNCLKFYSSYSGYSDYDPQPQYAILPEMSGLAGKQVTLQARGYNATSTFKIGTMTDPADAGTFVAITEQALTTSYQEFEYVIPAIAEGNYLAIMIDAATSSRTTNGVYIDDISIANPPACPKPSSLAYANVTDAAVTLSWTAAGEATAWQICLNGDEENLIDANTNPFTVEGLAATTAYTAKVRTYCSGSSQSEWTSEVNFSTTAVATVVGDSWSDDFEGGSCGWELINGTLTNNWSWGAAANNGGTNGLYISNDGGTTNAYTHGYTMVYATKLLNFAEGKYEFSYDWKCNGESTYDYLRVALVPASATLTAGTSAPSGFSYSALPTGWVALDGGSKLNLQTSWQSKSATINVAAGNYYMVLAWYNDGSGGSNPPAAVDNVSITRVACPYDVAGLEVADDPAVTTTTATINWTAGEATQWQVAYSTNSNFEGATTTIVNAATKALTGLTPSTVYYVKVRAYCGGEDYGAWCDAISFPTACDAISAVGYSENFDSYSTGNNVLPVCWTDINNTSYSGYQGYPKVYNSSSHSSPNCLYFYSYYSSYTDYDPQPQYAIMGEMTDLAGKQITLQARGSNNVSTFKVGTMSNPANAATFTEITSSLDNPASITTSYQEYTFYIPSNTTDRYVAFMIEAASSTRTSNSVYIDDIEFSVAPTCWQPQNLTSSDVTNEGATLTWQRHAMGEETAWVLQYSTDNTFATNTTTENVNTNPTYTIASGLAATTTYYVRVKPACDNEGNFWSETINFTTEASCMVPNSLAISGVAAHTANLNWNGNNDSYTLRYRKAITVPVNIDETYDFDDNSLQGWTVYDEDGDGYSWSVNNGDANSGSYCMRARYNSSAASSNWLISPEIPLGGTLRFYAKRYNGGSGENFQVYVSTTGTDIANFIAISEETPATTTYTLYEFDLGGYSGNGYVAIKHTDASNQWYLYVDDITYTNNIAGVYEDWVTVNNATKPYSFSDLEADETYYEAQVNGYCNSGDITTDWSEPVSFTTTIACPAPTSLAYSNVTGHTADLTWNVNDNPTTNYVLTKNGGESNIVVSITAGVASYTLEGLDGETEYTVSVRANCGNVDGYSLESNEVTFTTQITCAAPSALAASNETTTSMDLSWTNGDGEEAWVIAYKKGGDANFTEVNVTTNPYTLTGLTDGKTYTLKVRANCGNVDGLSQWSGEITHATQASCPAPTNVAASSVTAHGATITWDGEAPNHNLEYRTVSTAEVDNTYDFEDGMQGWTTIDADGHGNAWSRNSGSAHGGSYSMKATYNSSYDHQDYLVSPQISLGGTFSFYAKKGGSYTDNFRVYLSTTGNADASDFTIELTDGDVTPTTTYGQYTYNLSAYSGTGYVAIVYTAPADQLSLYIDDINITATVVSGYGAWQTVDDATSPHVFDALNAETIYEVRVIGDCGSSTSPYSDVVTFTTLVACSSTPASLAAAAGNPAAHSEVLTWTKTGDATAWQLCLNGDEENLTDLTSSDVDIDGTTVTYTVTGLTNGTDYTAKVRANCGGVYNDVSAWSNTVNFTTNSGTAVPTGLAVSDVSSDRATASWTGVAANDDHASYELYYSTTNATPAVSPEAGDNYITGITETSRIITGLDETTQYYLWVRDNCGADGISAWSSVVSFTTTASCPQPTDVAASNVTNESATITWDGHGETAFTVRYKTDADWTTETNKTSPYNLINLDANTTYTVQVQASSCSGGEWSAEYEFTTKCDPITDFPWTENFEGYSANSSTGGNNTYALNDPCWKNEHVSGTGTYLFMVCSNSQLGNSTNKLSLPDQSNGTLTKLVLPGMTLPDASYQFSIDVLRSSSYSEKTGEGIRVYVSTDGEIAGATELAFIPRYYGLSNSVIPAESTQGWYTYKLTLGISGTCYIILQGENQYGTATYTDNFKVGAPEFEKTIDANKWYAIASPVHNSGDNETLAGVTNLTSGTYDLYGYTEDAGTWDKPTTTLDLGKGYIYRVADAVTLKFVGIPNSGSISYDLSYEGADNNIKGFNLVGNPFPQTATPGMVCYSLTPSGTWHAELASYEVPICEAVLVKTNGIGNEVSFTPAGGAKGVMSTPAITFTVSNDKYEDVAYARFDNGAVLPKIGHLEPNAPALSIPVNGRQYAIADLGNGCESFDMVFSGIGDYTISASGDATYLHLIDKVTGSDIDLLSQPYTFKAGIGDITSRFIVKLVPDGETVSAGNFAFRNGNGWTIEGDGTLEAYDALGRRIFAQEISSSNYQLSTASFPAAGVYVLRMGGNSQKIVVTE